jgi:predicted small lipoprotein YifL
MFQRRTLGLLFSFLMLTACGQKGALYLPAEAPKLEEQNPPEAVAKKDQLKTPKAEDKTSPEPDGHMP